ncbi:hypothetical protein JRO89_XS08G0053000 [Xanthoceras sorbifolium]|uniref:Uncharacterized protein n=1 Tax=Xanthoceras sorbifolium TaxID=99658 RepID=A0ABQ8HNR6_9ROSI|nr:hypothetical protein JRO89_XS08G0053000 [Xanthoceras sorbifolium]
MRGSPGKGRGTRDRRGGSTESTRLGCYSASAAALRRLLIGLMQTPRRSSLSKRKAKFIEGDFDTYVKHNQQPYVWGGEPELLMASHVLK